MTSLDLEQTLYDLLPNIAGNFSAFQLSSGFIEISELSSLTLIHPAYYLTNFTEYQTINISDFYGLETSFNSSDLQDLFFESGKFEGGIISFCVVMSGIVTASWMLFLLLLLSANTIPNSLLLTNLFYSICHTVTLAKVTNVLKDQMENNYSDIKEVGMMIQNSISLITIKCLSALLIYISWTDLTIQMNKYEKRRKILVLGISLSIISVGFKLACEILVKNGSQSSQRTLKILRGFHFFFLTLILICFQYETLKYSLRKKEFAYHKRSLSLAIFSLLILMAPYAFIIIDLTSNQLRLWSTYTATFSELCISVVSWEWLHTIKVLDARDESKTVLGRQLSNDSFMVTTERSETSSQIYLLRSTNIVAIFSTLKSKVLRILKPKIKKNHVSVIELMPVSSKQSEVSDLSEVSLVGDYPQFNVDQRYLRTPSTYRRSPYNE